MFICFAQYRHRNLKSHRGERNLKHKKMRSPPEKKEDETKIPAPEIKIIEAGLNPNLGPGKEEAKIESAVMESINITNAEKDGHFLLTRASKNAITTVQEDKLKPLEIAKLKGACREAGLKFECGPNDRTSKTPSAGVGMMVRSDITFVRAEKM